ncbi:hypothetical protein L1987_37397 [Smallanthus sonchifolius]|uniref:Uncharacterized protein n=1 Tax=Smallanthus sonchifolius TaxID=185202 RepID=A0ACB9HG88_9ASTR|nr:hypothetical protein L1987_37397 [Smallanthus sonchifolius]
MVPCRNLQHIFDKPLETPTSWEPNDHIKPTRDSRSLFPNNIDETTSNGYFSPKQTKHHPCNVGMNAESLSMCTEGLGFESFDDVEHLKDEEAYMNDHNLECSDHHTIEKHVVSRSEHMKKSRVKGMEFPPPISSIGLSGKPWVCLKSYRSNGRFILKEVRIPTQELLHACREDGRLKLQFIQSDDEPLCEEGDDDDELTSQG